MRNHNLTRAGLKREAKKFKVGDVVTWELGHVIGHTGDTVVEVTRTGLYVDVTGQKDSEFWGSRVVDGRVHYFVAFDGNVKCFKGGRGPIIKLESKS